MTIDFFEKMMETVLIESYSVIDVDDGLANGDFVSFCSGDLLRCVLPFLLNKTMLRCIDS